ncbi:MAG: tRNA lysidine(34) synthetase TilS [Marinilabiliales bacterium]|nr:MAG: tRNA lysidine(34) synthetase TilS [Marinilabiliales bacterium]
MDELFQDFIKTNDLFTHDDRILLGLSGGIDSMVMLHLMTSAGLDVYAAHCNFKLRGAESDEDQIFVESECRRQNIRFIPGAFNTKEYAAEKGISLQMAARELRYEWFLKLLGDLDCRYVAIAHNKNDVAETFLINLLRGTGLRGLTGIRPKTGSIVRPLLFADRKSISEYASHHNILHREDSSNYETKYLRNYVRHAIIPEFEKISPGFIGNIYDTAGRLKEADAIFSETIENKFSYLFESQGNDYIVSINSLSGLHPLPAYLYGFLKRWNFPREVTEDILVAMQGGTSGKQFYSPTHRLIRDREHLIITALPVHGLTRYYIDEDSTTLSEPLNMRISKHRHQPGFKIPADRNIACVDAGMLHYPLLLRKWQKGDYFQPLGMGGLKKLSDFFIDNKFSIAQKERVWILASGSRIVWIAGHRLDDRFRITERTKDILMIEILE